MLQSQLKAGLLGWCRKTAQGFQGGKLTAETLGNLLPKVQQTFGKDITREDLVMVASESGVFVDTPPRPPKPNITGVKNGEKAAAERIRAAAARHGGTIPESEMRSVIDEARSVASHLKAKAVRTLMAELGVLEKTTDDGDGEPTAASFSPTPPVSDPEAELVIQFRDEVQALFGTLKVPEDELVHVVDGLGPPYPGGLTKGQVIAIVRRSGLVMSPRERLEYHEAKRQREETLPPTGKLVTPAVTPKPDETIVPVLEDGLTPSPPIVVPQQPEQTTTVVEAHHKQLEPPDAKAGSSETSGGKEDVKKYKLSALRDKIDAPMLERLEVEISLLTPEFYPVAGVSIDNIREAVNGAGIDAGLAAIRQDLTNIRNVRRYFLGTDEERSSLASQLEKKFFSVSLLQRILKAGFTKWRELELGPGEEGDGDRPPRPAKNKRGTTAPPVRKPARAKAEKQEDRLSLPQSPESVLLRELVKTRPEVRKAIEGEVEKLEAEMSAIEDRLVAYRAILAG